MSYNGSGTFNINTAGQPVVTGTTITSTAFNLLTADLATGLSTALTKDGQSTPTANIPMGTFKLTGLGAGTAATDAAQYGQLQAGATTIAVVTGTDTLTGTLTPAITAYATGNLFSFVAANTNTGAATIALNGLTAKNITKLGSTALAAGDIVSGRVYLIEYDGTRFQLLNPSASSVASFSAGSTGLTPSTATTGAVTLAGTLATTNGGTGLTSFTANGVLYASSSSALASGSALTFNGTKLQIGSFGNTGRLFETYGSDVLFDGAGQFDLVLGDGGVAYMSLTTTDNATALKIRNYSGNSDIAVFERTTGNVGIGTSSPQAKVHSTGAILSSGALVALSASNIFIDQATSALSRIGVVGANTSTFGTLTFSQYSSNGSLGRDALILSAEGNLGLGVTPTAGGATTNFEIGPYGATIAARNNASAPQLYISSNAVGQGYTPTYKVNGYATQYVMQGFDGAHRWLIAPSGTAGNAISFTQAMTLDASGNLLVGVVTANANGGVLQLKSGITFPATQSASSDANTLDDYEEGTWTPNANFGWTDTGTVTRTGTYTKVGRQVFITVRIQASGGGSVSMNAANISNLPFTAANSAAGAWSVVSAYGSAAQTQNVMVDGTVMYFTGSWVGVANYVYAASATYTV